MKILMVTNRVKTYALNFQNFIEPLLGLGHEVVWAADFSNFIGDTSVIPCPIRQIDIYSYPFHRTNIKAYKQIKQIISQEHIDAFYCSTPIGSTLGRIAAHSCGVKKIVYAAHGFLHFKGAPLINRTLYKALEYALAHWTDTLITINNEDFESACKMTLRSGDKPYLIHGAGVNIGVQVSVDKVQKRKEIDIPENATIVISAGDLNKNKNNEVLIRALGELKQENIYYVICGVGAEQNNLMSLANSLGVAGKVKFLGYRTDMPELISCSDIFAMPSHREGVPRAILEAMDLGLPCVGSKTRGIDDLIDEGIGGFKINANDYKGFADRLLKLAKNEDLRIAMGIHNREKAKQYSKEIVREEYIRIFKEVFC